MESLDFLSKLLDGKVVLGSREDINENLSIIPVYKVKISFLNLKTDIKNNNGDGASGSLNVCPICLLKISNNNIDIISLDCFNKKDNITDIIPSMISNIDINNILKGLKLN